MTRMSFVYFVEVFCSENSYFGNFVSHLVQLLGALLKIFTPTEADHKKIGHIGVLLQNVPGVPVPGLLVLLLVLVGSATGEAVPCNCMVENWYPGIRVPGTKPTGYHFKSIFDSAASLPCRNPS